MVTTLTVCAGLEESMARTEGEEQLMLKEDGEEQQEKPSDSQTESGLSTCLSLILTSSTGRHAFEHSIVHTFIFFFFYSSGGNHRLP